VTLSSNSLHVTNSFQENAGTLRRYKCQQLPPYIILNFKRFTKNIFVEEKNPTIVNFPLRGLDFRECTFLSTRRIHTCSNSGMLDLDAPPNHPPTVYDLVANVTHESTAGTTRDKENTVYKVHLRAGGTDDDWYQIQDLIVEKTRKEMIFLGETVLQVGCAVFTSCFLTHISVGLGTKKGVFGRRDGGR